MPDKPKSPATGGTNPALPKVRRVRKPRINPGQSRLPEGLKPRPGGGKGGRPPRFPGRTGGR